MKEINVLVILGCGFAIFVIDCTTAYNMFSPFLSFIYLFETILFVFLDALKNKSRQWFSVLACYLFCLIFIIFVNWYLEAGTFTVLFRYGEDLYFKTPVKRSIFIQVLVFGFQGVKTMLKDTKMELMMFATGQIYQNGTVNTQAKTRKQKMKICMYVTA